MIAIVLLAVRRLKVAVLEGDRRDLRDIQQGFRLAFSGPSFS
jgi:hypothetical protein